MIKPRTGHAKSQNQTTVGILGFVINGDTKGSCCWFIIVFFPVNNKLLTGTLSEKPALWHPRPCHGRSEECGPKNLLLLPSLCFPGVDPALQKESKPQMPVPAAAPASASSSSSSSKFHRARSGGARDERYRSGKGRDRSSLRGISLLFLSFGAWRCPWITGPEGLFCLTKMWNQLTPLYMEFRAVHWPSTGFENWKNCDAEASPGCCAGAEHFPLADIHTEAVQAALAKHKEQKMALPMPTKRRSTFVQSPADACTPPGEALWHTASKQPY